MRDSSFDYISQRRLCESNVNDADNAQEKRNDSGLVEIGAEKSCAKLSMPGDYRRRRRKEGEIITNMQSAASTAHAYASMRASLHVLKPLTSISAWP